MPEGTKKSESVGSFGSCEVCHLPRESVIIDDDLVLQCPAGHRTD